MLKFKPGQKVIVSGELTNSMVPEMKQFIGKTVTISNKQGGNLWPYRIVESERWVWMEEMFTSTEKIVDPNILFKMKKRGAV